MSKLKDKSDFNIISADMLLKEGYHSASIHCSYYAVFQRMKYSMMRHLKLSTEDYQTRFDSSNYNSHRFLIQLVCLEYKKITWNKYKTEQLNTLIDQLKELREISDYDEVEMNDSDSDQAVRKRTDIIFELKDVFKI